MIPYCLATYLSHKDITGCNERFSSSSLHSLLHDPCHFLHHCLHDAELIKDIDEGTEEHNHRQHLKPKAMLSVYSISQTKSVVFLAT